MSSLSITNGYYLREAESLYGAYAIQPSPEKGEISDTQKSELATIAESEIKDEVLLSKKALELYSLEKDKNENGETTQDKEKSQNENSNEGEISKKLTPEEEKQVAELKARDAEVKTHEQAHRAAAAGINTSAPSYEYETGPDGQRYAVGGEVNVSIKESSDPEETLRDAEIMKAAALAPAEPSSQDLAVARMADGIIQKAQREIADKKTEQTQTEAGSMPESTANPTNELKETADSDNNKLSSNNLEPQKVQEETSPSKFEELSFPSTIYIR